MRLSSVVAAAFAVLLAGAAPAFAQSMTPLLPPGTTTGSWQFYCKDGKVVLVQIIVLVPGEFQLAVPRDACPIPPAASQAPKPSPKRPLGAPA